MGTGSKKAPNITKYQIKNPLIDGSLTLNQGDRVGINQTQELVKYTDASNMHFAGEYKGPSKEGDGVLRGEIRVEGYENASLTSEFTGTAIAAGYMYYPFYFTGAAGAETPTLDRPSDDCEAVGFINENLYPEYFSQHERIILGMAGGNKQEEIIAQVTFTNNVAADAYYKTIFGRKSIVQAFVWVNEVVNAGKDIVFTFLKNGAAIGGGKSISISNADTLGTKKTVSIAAEFNDGDVLSAVVSTVGGLPSTAGKQTVGFDAVGLAGN